MQASERAKNAVFVPSDLDLWPLILASKLIRAGTKHVFCVNWAQIRSAVPRDISYTNEKTQTDGTKNSSFCSSLHAVIMPVLGINATECYVYIILSTFCEAVGIPEGRAVKCCVYVCMITWQMVKEAKKASKSASDAGNHANMDAADCRQPFVHF